MTEIQTPFENCTIVFYPFDFVVANCIPYVNCSLIFSIQSSKNVRFLNQISVCSQTVAVSIEMNALIDTIF